MYSSLSQKRCAQANSGTVASVSRTEVLFEWSGGQVSKGLKDCSAKQNRGLDFKKRLKIRRT